MPYDNETGEFWFNEEEKDWVIKHPKRWQEFLTNPMYRLRKDEPPTPQCLAKKVEEALGYEKHQTYLPTSHIYQVVRGFSLPNQSKLIKHIVVHRKWDAETKSHVIDKIVLIPARANSKKPHETWAAHPDDFKDAVFETRMESRWGKMRLPNVTAKTSSVNGNVVTTCEMEFMAVRGV